MRIIFFGADPWFSAPVLKALAAAGHEILLAVSKGEAAGKFKVQSSKFKAVDAKTPEDISRRRLESLIRPGLGLPRPGLFRPDAIVLASFGPPFLPAEILNWPKYGCLNVHASLLPRWRGASPVFASLREGDKETGVSIMRMTEKIDRGPVLGQKILPDAVKADNRETLTKKLGKLGVKLIVETLKKLEKGQITETQQPIKSPTSYTRRLTKHSGRIDWSLSPIQIERFIRAVTPWPGATSNVKFKIKNEKWQTIENVKILKAHLEQVKNDLILVVDQIQLPGKTLVSWKQFVAGHPGAELY